MSVSDRTPITGQSACRGQGSIGSVLLLIAALLIATTTAGVFFEVTGGLQSDMEAAGEQGAEQVSGGIVVIGATGFVDDATDTIDSVTLVVSWEGQPVDLTDVVVQPTDGSAESVSTTGPVTVESITDDDGSLSRGVLNAESDRAGLRIDLSAIGVGRLEPGESQRIQLIDPGGTSTQVRLNVPESLSGRDTVSL